VIDAAEAGRLLDAEEYDRLLTLVTPEEVGLAWCRYANRTWRVEELAWKSDPDGWAAELVQEDEFLANKRFQREFLVTIVDAVPEEFLSWVGSGPLSEFLNEEDPDQLAWIEAQAARSDRFRRALCNVLISSSASRDAFLRLERAAGETLARVPKYRLVGFNGTAPGDEVLGTD
jgi:hypothetical protein